MRDLYVPLCGTPQCYVEAPITEVDFYMMRDTHTKETHEQIQAAAHLVRSFQPQGFFGSSLGLVHDVPTIGVYMAGWDAVEVRRVIRNLHVCVEN